MITVNQILNFLCDIAPLQTAMSFDNCGLLVGSKSAIVTKTVLALDITKDVVDYAKNIGAELIISHHPVIFNPIKSLKSDDVPYLLAKYDINAICMHTNLDGADQYGVNVCLANACGLQNITLDKDNLIAYGDIDMATSQSFATQVKQALDCEGVRFTNNSKNITKVAVSSGAGGCNIFNAHQNNVDAFVTGEIKHHELLFAVQNDICVVDVGHFKSEAIVLPTIKDLLRQNFADVSFIINNGKNDNISYL